MPTENERKFVLDLKSLDEVKRLATDCNAIRQGYLARDRGTTRVRQSIDADGFASHTFTFKRASGDRLIEIETEIDRRDFEDLYAQCDDRLEKTRYSIPSGNLCWEVDFYHEADRNYFVVAEIELPEGVEQPDEIPPFISEFLLHRVTKQEEQTGKYSAAALTVVSLANRLYADLL